ncbi:hypothetical protein LVJ94_34700 [Pendulispora rubella]|uniref:Uncharacterized protein n=1 Tax=Pendulispora rubella TaxID=2741070 RepID=A0ABZ2KVE0_9BACT
MKTMFNAFFNKMLEKRFNMVLERNVEQAMADFNDPEFDKKFAERLQELDRYAQLLDESFDRAGQNKVVMLLEEGTRRIRHPRVRAAAETFSEWALNATAMVYYRGSLQG